MAQTRASQAFLFVGNDPCLDFVNTQMIVRGALTDLLPTFEDLVAWLVKAKLLTEMEGESVSRDLIQEEKKRVFERAKAFRSTLREMADQIVRRKTIAGAVVTEINRLLSQRSGYPQIIQTKGGFEQKFVLIAARTDRILTPLAEAASDLLCHVSPALIKKCKNSACILYFYDTTKNHTRNWCSMRVCGNRVKVAAHFRRKRQAKRKRE